MDQRCYHCDDAVFFSFPYPLRENLPATDRQSVTSLTSGFSTLRSKVTTMLIKPIEDSDVQNLINIAVDTFHPFYEEYVRALLGEEVFHHQHGNWRQDYQSDIPTLHSPESGRHLAAAEVNDEIVGFVAWKTNVKPNHGEIYLLAVSRSYRQQHVGRKLCLHALEEMKKTGVEVVGVGTGGDSFHAPARALYESLGFTPIPVMAYLKKI
jgi:ribosomal protein S18 acetylase RimI-like enzyme